METEKKFKIRTVEAIISPPPHHFVGDGFRVHNFIPRVPPLSMQRMSPFLVLDYNSKFYFPPSETPRGVGVHPHRGFETVTIAYKGSVAHHDSSGGGGVIKEGDVQWMTAAGGVLHKEYHEENFSKKGGDFQMIQLWINLPAKNKKDPPKYQAITADRMGKYQLPNEIGSVVEIIAGEYNGIKGPANTYTPVHLYNLNLSKGASADFSFPADFNTALIVLEGEIIINDNDTAPLDHFVLMKNKNESFSVKAKENAKVFLMSGEPINEPIFAYGPFVMNTEEEIIQAYDDFNTGKFGYLE